MIKHIIALGLVAIGALTMIGAVLHACWTDKPEDEDRLARLRRLGQI